jgi:hypothetical protein
MFGGVCSQFRDKIASVWKGHTVQLPQTCLCRRLTAEGKATKLGDDQVVFTFVEENGLAAGIVYEVHINGVYPAKPVLPQSIHDTNRTCSDI